MSRSFRVALLSILALVAGGSILVAGGFLWFVAILARAEPDPSPRNADAIVALTGGQSRVSDATDLLARGSARRLLITGVHPQTSRGEIARKLGASRGLLECCVDLDRDALNTVGNAVETRRWVREHGFRSIIVVTSAYHMPRALVEIRQRLPDVRLVPYPVASATLQLDRWWDHRPTLRVLAGEYVKYLVSLARAVVDPADEPETVARHRPTILSVRSEAP